MECVQISAIRWYVYTLYVYVWSLFVLEKEFQNSKKN